MWRGSHRRDRRSSNIASGVLCTCNTVLAVGRRFHHSWRCAMDLNLSTKFSSFDTPFVLAIYIKSRYLLLISYTHLTRVSFVRIRIRRVNRIDCKSVANMCGEQHRYILAFFLEIVCRLSKLLSICVEESVAARCLLCILSKLLMTGRNDATRRFRSLLIPSTCDMSTTRQSGLFPPTTVPDMSSSSSSPCSPSATFCSLPS